jgi:DNA polymerase elongation subunit (family B)
LKPVARDDLAPLRIASLDIECYSATGAFPSAFEKSDVCFQIAIETRIGNVIHDRKVLCVKETACADSEWFPTERAMLERFAEYLRDELDPDVITGWNIFGFDLEYMYTRSVVCGCSPDTFTWGRLRETPVELVTKTLASSALGSNTLKLVPMIGRYVFDMFQDVKREHKLESYSLNNVSRHFLGDSKLDMPVREIFGRFAEGDPVRLGEVAEYCLKDTELPHRIADRLCLIPNLLEMAKATWVPLSYLSERGQQIKVYSQIVRKARELGFMVPTFRVDRNAPPTGDDSYQGATVLEAQTGAYYSPITALDFASLYPSVMRAHNLCYSTLVMDKKYLDIPGVAYETYGPHVFAQSVPSLLPIILNELATFRKKAKKDMAAAEGTPLEAVYNGRQLAYKISMNSVYGFTGATKGMLPLVAIASTVTMRGRQMIDETKTYVEENFPGAHVRYGDSVPAYTPILVRKDGIVYVQRIFEIGDFEYKKGFVVPETSYPANDVWTWKDNKWSSYEGFLKQGTDKQQKELSEWEAWTHLGWRPIRRVIRHKCKKKIYEVVTRSGIVEVTEDHSLLDVNLNEIKPTDLKNGQLLCHGFPDVTNSVYHPSVFDPNYMFTDMADVESRHRTKTVSLRNGLSSQLKYVNLRRLGLDPKMTRISRGFCGSWGAKKQQEMRSLVQVKEVDLNDHSINEYVYDIETDAGTFQAGVGQMIVKNTDSVMVEFDVQGRKGQAAIDYSWAQGELAAEACTKLFRAPNDLELEKVYCPYFLYSKKRYAAKMYEKKGDAVVFKKIDIKGLQVVRRDTCMYVRGILKQLLNLVLDSNDPRPAIEYARQSARQLLGGKVETGQLLMSKQLGSAYKTRQPHVEVRDKIRKRSPGSEPQNGDRVAFLITKGPGLLCDKAEDPAFVTEHGVPVDFMYYFDHQLQKPVCDLLEPLVGTKAFETIFKSVDYLTTRSITTYFTKAPGIPA